MTAAEDRDIYIIMSDSCLVFSFITQEMNNKLFGAMKGFNVLQHVQNATFIKITPEGNQRPHDVTLAAVRLFGSSVTGTDAMLSYIVNETYWMVSNTGDITARTQEQAMKIINLDITIIKADIRGNTAHYIVYMRICFC